MSDIWIRLKFWIKTTLMSVLAVYAILFIYNNTGVSRQTAFWWWFNKEYQASVFVLALMAFCAGVLSTLLIRTTFITLKQFRLLKVAKMNRDAAEMQAKAAKLQTRATSNVVAPDPTQL